MNFNIIDGNDDYLDKLPEFVEAYNGNKLSIPELREELDISQSDYRKLRKAAIEENLITLKTRGRKKTSKPIVKPRNYSRYKSRGYIYYNIYKNDIHYCSVKTEQQAQEIVKRLEAVNWDKTQAQRIKEEVIKEIQ